MIHYPYDPRQERTLSAYAIREMFFLPPLAIARLGGSDTPLDCFHWAADPGIHAGGRTVIVPAPSFGVQADGSLCLYEPKTIVFSDDGKLRPVAPFFELWVRNFQGDEEPLTLEVLEKLDVGLGDLRFTITVANRKAARRVQHASCEFVARADVLGDDHARRRLDAYSPSDPDHPPLVRQDHPIPLGHFQVIRPAASPDGMSLVRVRFTPGKGEVYGPPDAIASIASPLPEGEDLAWKHDMRGRMHDIVPPQNRILNPDALWTSYIAGQPAQTDPEPADSYDGAKLGCEKSWSVVDDSCDGVLEAHLVVRGRRFSATARVTASPPDYAPDRRHFLSAADDLADRDKPKTPVLSDTMSLTEQEVADLLVRVFETASQINLDAERFKFIALQDDGYGPADASDPPHTDFRSMTADDAPYADLATELIGTNAARRGRFPSSAAREAMPSALLAFTDMARSAHAKLAEPHHLIEFLRTRAAHVKSLVRKPYGHFPDYDKAGNYDNDKDFRDPRVDRDTQYDMRMPPYMRDSDDTPLSLTWRQYHALMDFIDALGKRP